MSTYKMFKGWIILNQYGDIWTRVVFQEKREAESEIENFKKKFIKPPDMSNHKIVLVAVQLFPTKNTL